MKKVFKHPLVLFPAAAVFSIALLILISAQKPDSSAVKNISGKASFYANMLHGLNTSSGDIYNKNDFTCAHRTLPFNTLLRVTNTTNGKQAIVRVNDRGPYKKGRIIDLSRAAAQKLGMVSNGVTKVNIQELTFLNLFPIYDSLLHAGEIIDIHGKLRHPKNNMIRVWGTENLKHALYMATNLEIEYKADNVYIKVVGNDDKRNYILYIPGLDKKENGDKLIADLKQDGFNQCRYEKN